MPLQPDGCGGSSAIRGCYIDYEKGMKDTYHGIDVVKCPLDPEGYQVRWPFGRRVRLCGPALRWFSLRVRDYPDQADYLMTSDLKIW